MARSHWMVCYVLLGLIQSGMMPVILPLTAPPGATAGFTYATFAAAGIVAPFVGAWSDLQRRHRLTLAGGLGVAALGLLVHALPVGLAQHMATAARRGAWPSPITKFEKRRMLSKQITTRMQAS